MRAPFSSTSDRGFKILGIQQIAIGGLSKDKLSNFWTGTLGIPKISTFKSTNENVDEDILLCGQGDYAVEIDLMQPIDPEKSPKVGMLISLFI